MWIHAHLPHTTRPSKHHSYLSPPHKKTTETNNKKTFKKNERTYRDGIPKKQPNKVGMVPQYPYGLSSLYLLPFFQPQHTHTHTHRPIPAMPHQPYPQPIECAWQLQHFTMQHTSPPHTTTYPPHAAIHTHRLDYIHVTTYLTFYTTIHTYNTLPPATTPFHLTNS